VTEARTKLLDSLREKCLIERIIDNEEGWKNRDVLNTEPFRTVIKPLLSFAQRLYLSAGIIHLIFMILMTVHYFPDRCSLAHQFGLNVSKCDNTQLNDTTVPLALKCLEEKIAGAIRVECG
jgi:hypothetical protein